MTAVTTTSDPPNRTTRLRSMRDQARERGRALSPRTRRLLLAAAVVVSTLLSVWLRQRGRTWAVADMIYDDGYFTRSAGFLIRGDWLGPYDMLTLSKGPTYPLFIAGAYELDIPLKLAEHGLHIAAAAMAAWAVWRIVRLRSLAVAAYAIVALNPAYLGSAASRISREVVYGSLSVMLVAGVVVFLSYIPALVRRGLHWAIPVTVLFGAAIGFVTAAYYMCREERTWLAPALAVAVLAGVAGWGRIGRAWIPKGLFAAGGLIVAGLVLAGSVGWVTAQNEEHYGAAVITDLVEGPVGEAYAQWQRVDVGQPRRFVVVTRAQRLAVYDVSPAAAELRRALEWYPGREMWGAGCVLAGVCDDYSGAQFVWAMRLAATRAGHMGSAAETHEFFERIADDIEAACGVEFDCTSPGVASMPPLDRAPIRPLPRSVFDTAAFLASYDVADPNRVLTGLGPSPYIPSGGTIEQWVVMSDPVRELPRNQVAYRVEEDAAMENQELVRVLWAVYRYGGIVAGVAGVAGLALAIVTGAWRRHLTAVLFTATLAAAVAGRILFIALLDATAYPAAGNGIYMLPGTDFYVLFGLVGSWLLATVLRERRGEAAATAGPSSSESNGSNGSTPPDDGANGAPRQTDLPDRPSTVLVP